MALEIRPFREEERAAFQRVPGIVFGNYNGQPWDAANDPSPIPPDWSVCAFEDGELTTTYAAWPFTMRLNGAPAPAAGVTFVGTLPQFRRRGHLRKIMEHDFKKRYEQHEQPLAVLLASVAAIYQRYGYSVVSSRNQYTIDPRWINFAPTVPAARGSWREVLKDDLPLIKQIYREFATPRNGYLHRAQVMWDSSVLALRPGPGGPDMGPSLLAVYEEDGEPKGYVAYSAKFYEEHADRAGPGQRLFVRDYAWLTPGAYRAMWEFFKTFDLVKRVIVGAAPADDPAFDIMLDPRELDTTRYDWMLGRIIDLERALPLRPYGEGRVVFQVRDEMCPWNADRWLLEAGPEGTAVSRTKESAQLTLDISALAQLVFGQVSPSLAVRFGRAEASPDAPLDRWDAMWRTKYAPFCPDGF
ncbi:MAG: GNAT family N-acetyltransferase [Dehalococcoidia bacterium]